MDSYTSILSSLKIDISHLCVINFHYLNTHLGSLMPFPIRLFHWNSCFKKKLSCIPSSTHEHCSTSGLHICLEDARAHVNCPVLRDQRGGRVGLTHFPWSMSSSRRVPYPIGQKSVVQPPPGCPPQDHEDRNLVLGGSQNWFQWQKRFH